MDRSRTYQAAGSLLIGASILGIVVNVFHPRFSESTYADPAAMFAEVDASGIWLVDHLLILAAVAAFTVGLVGLCANLAEEERARSWGAGAAVVALLAGATGLVAVMIEGLAGAAFAASAAAGEPIAGAALSALSLAGFATLGLLLFGAAPMVLGMAIVRSEWYPHWTGFVALAAGVLGIVTGVIASIQGEISNASTVLFLVASLPTMLVTIYLGVLLRRHASEAAPRAVAPPSPA